MESPHDTWTIVETHHWLSDGIHVKENDLFTSDCTLLQSVTGVQNTDDHNSYWQIKAKQGDDCRRGYVYRTRALRFATLVVTMQL